MGSGFRVFIYRPDLLPSKYRSNTHATMSIGGSQTQNSRYYNRLCSVNIPSSRKAGSSCQVTAKSLQYSAVALANQSFMRTWHDGQVVTDVSVRPSQVTSQMTAGERKKEGRCIT